MSHLWITPSPKKEGVYRTYKGFDGYASMMAYIGTEGYAINFELREGKQHCQNGTVEFLQETIRLCKKLTDQPLLVRLDSGNNSIDNVAVLIDAGCYFIIKRNLRRESILTTDGGYCGMENSLLAEEKNITLVTTDLKGSEVSEHWADFEFNEDGTKLLRCAAGHEPKSSGYDKNTQKCKASFPLATCKNCPYYSQCHPTEHKRVAAIKIVMRTAFHARQQRFLKTEDFKTLARFQNGVETVPAALRSRHHVDRMPVRGYIKTKLFFGFKVAGMNARKLIRYLTGLVKVATYPEIA